MPKSGLLYGLFLLPLQVDMNFPTLYITIFLFLRFVLPTHGAAAFSVTDFSYSRTEGASSFDAKVDFPVEGSAVVMRSVRKWICEILETEMPEAVDGMLFRDMLKRSAMQFLTQTSSGSRKVEISWSFEDPQCVTFQSVITDRDSVTWISEDCASFSKKDGHRITASEIFSCSEAQIKQLMWQFRADLPMEAAGPGELYVGNAGFIDGWIVVIGPARNHSGAAYKIRYQAAEPWLQAHGKGGGYYHD